MPSDPLTTDVVAPDDRIPVTVLTGFLGSGKTTLVNRILQENHGMRIAVIENEFGEVGIDDALLFDTEEEIFEMNNGCICCTVRGDLIRILGSLVRRRDRFDRIVIETTGLADPAPVAQTFFVDDDVRRSCRLDAIVTLVDARHALAHLDEVRADGVENEAIEQVAFADRVVVNKVDLVDDAELAAVELRIRSINGPVQMIRSRFADVPLADVLDVRAFDLESVLRTEPTFLEQTDHQHDLSISSVGIEVPGSLDPDRFTAWLRSLLSTRGADIFRSKGIVSIAGADRRLVFQAVHMLLDTDEGAPWTDDAERSNRLVFIGRGLDREELERGFASCLVMAAAR